MTGVAQSAGAELAAALGRSGGTVTEFLEDLAGEPVDADIMAQEAGPGGNDHESGLEPLGLEPGDQLLRRAVLLTGRTTKRRFVYAESAIAADRIPDTARHRLQRSRDPIGRVLVGHNLTVRRTALAGPVEARSIDPRSQSRIRRATLSRRYLIAVGGDPVMVVNEWFLPAVAEALARLHQP